VPPDRPSIAVIVQRSLAGLLRPREREVDADRDGSGLPEPGDVGPRSAVEAVGAHAGIEPVVARAAGHRVVAGAAAGVVGAVAADDRVVAVPAEEDREQRVRRRRPGARSALGAELVVAGLRVDVGDGGAGDRHIGVLGDLTGGQVDRHLPGGRLPDADVVVLAAAAGDEDVVAGAHVAADLDLGAVEHALGGRAGAERSLVRRDQQRRLARGGVRVGDAVDVRDGRLAAAARDRLPRLVLDQHVGVRRELPVDRRDVVDRGRRDRQRLRAGVERARRRGGRGCRDRQHDHQDRHAPHGRHGAVCCGSSQPSRNSRGSIARGPH
jgi:hypothetical protein